MSKGRSTRKIKLSLVLMAISVNGLFAARAVNQELPEGKGVEIARNKCLSCHEADLIKQQRLSRQGWTREVEKMIRWGAPVTETEKEALIEYLAVSFGTKPSEANPSPTTNESRGKEIFENKCVVCHEADLTHQQRLSRQGWTREVEKMIRWGAIVTDDEKELLIDYLFKNYGPKR